MRLFPPGTGLRLASTHWCFAKDGNPTALALYKRHYSRYVYRDGREPKLFVGPGEKLVLITMDGDALFVWRSFISGDGQEGINCAVFRNESPILSSVLIIEAETAAAVRWPGQRFYTNVNGSKVRSSNPGCCFFKAGWRKCGVTSTRSLLILEKIP